MTAMLAEVGTQYLWDGQGDVASYPNFSLTDADYGEGTATVHHQGVVHTFTLQEGNLTDAPWENGEGGITNQRVQIQTGAGSVQPRRIVRRRVIVQRSRTSP